MKKNLLLSFFLLLLIPSVVMAQQEVSGKVTSSDDGAPLPGVNVVVKGTTQGTVTDIDGNYRITVPNGNVTLVYSFIGLATQEIPLNNRTQLDIQMATDTKQLSEVIVTAAGIEREQRSLGYSVQEVDGEALSQKSTNNVFESLQGKVAGLTINQNSGAPGGGATILIRGATSLAGNSRNSPLIVVDGIPIDNDFVRGDVGSGSAEVFGSGSIGGSRGFDINPEDIAEITVLKGPAAAALYGIRAANGAIVITTKRPSGLQGTSVAVTSSFNVSRVNILPNYQNDYGQGLSFRHHSPFSSNSWGRPFGAIPNDSITDHNGNRVAYVNYPDNVRDFFNDGYLWNNNIEFSGSNGASGFIVSVGRTDQSGIIPESDLNRTNIRLAGTTEFLGKVLLSGSFQYINTQILGSPQGNNGSSVFFLLPSIPRSYDLNGRPYLNPDGTQNWYSSTDHPLWSAKNNPATNEVDRFLGNIKLGYDFTDWLSLSYQFGFDVNGENRKEVYARGSSRFNDGLIIQDELTFRLYESTLLLSANKDLNEDFNLSVTLGHNLNSTKRDRFIVQGAGITTPGINNILNTETVTVDPRNGVWSNRRLMGVFADVTLGYKDWAYLNVTGRNDWSSTLPLANNSFFYPSISGTLIFTDALGITSDFLSFGKIKAAYATVGNDATPFLTTTTYVVPSLGNNTGSINFPFQGTAAFTQSNILGNDNLKPEETSSIEFGLTLGLLNNRFNVDLTYYDQETKDQILFLQLPVSTGYTSYVTNAGSITNKGFEAVLSGQILQNGPVRWEAIVNFSRNRNKVNELAEGLDATFLSGFTGAESSAVVGEPLGVFRGSPYARDPETGELLVLGTGVNRGQLFNSTEFSVIGDPNPDWNASLINKLSWKGIRLGFQFDIQKGGDIWSNTIGFAGGLGSLEETGVDREDPRVIPGVLVDASGDFILDDAGNKIANNIQVDAQTYWRSVNGAFFEGSIFDASYVRLREITLGYSLPSAILSNTPFKTFDVSLSARNLWTYAPNLGGHIDPEVANAPGALARGLEWNSSPGLVNYGINLKFTF
ncbi:SusC/RagA family TonB-linked outer membrane protein [Fulvivirga sedimenti]|uniref:SusC/RagA family TonB-linked outer membrane protein n=1 Tax=Fulvivirga sedimenti TaxID=2879465 RepID=A0A9X1HK60_9BACT|nr:SusC/RagA family TonB-linked outer membrane protein [Fulvivirga sedimenti]MCA6073674.1 SusC/RagA family TonB-linked outer membrane protein [Fulvivirga sedimenti]